MFKFPNQGGLQGLVFRKPLKEMNLGLTLEKISAT